jgi:hypothetical protein
MSNPPPPSTPNTPPRTSKVHRIAPARPHAADDARAYMPRIPWHFVALGTLTLVVVMGGYYMKQRQKAEQLRDQMIQVYEVELSEARDAYTKLRDKLEDLIVNAAATDPKNFGDARLKLANLRNGNGLYLRLPLAAAKTREGIAAAAKVAEPDQIAKCLGLAPASARGLYEKGDFLTPAYLKKLKEQTDVLHLRVEDEMLSRRIRADLPSVLGLGRSDWFMLVLEEGEERSEAPVRVFVWGLQQGELLFRARVQGEGTMLTTRILSKGTENAPPIEESKVRRGATDCSIAGKLKSLSDGG